MFRFTMKPSSGSHSQYLARNTDLVQCRYRRRTDVDRIMAAYYAAITLTSVQPHAYTLNWVCNFSQVLAVAPWWWFHCKSKHVGAAFIILICFNNSTFFTLCALVGIIKWLTTVMYALKIVCRLSRWVYSVYVPPWMWRQRFSPKRRNVFSPLH